MNEINENNENINISENINMDNIHYKEEKINRGKIGFLNNSRNEIYFDIRFLCKELQPNLTNNSTCDIRNIF